MAEFPNPAEYPNQEHYLEAYEAWASRQNNAERESNDGAHDLDLMDVDLDDETENGMGRLYYYYFFYYYYTAPVYRDAPYIAQLASIFAQ